MFFIFVFSYAKEHVKNIRNPIFHWRVFKENFSVYLNSCLGKYTAGWDSFEEKLGVLMRTDPYKLWFRCSEAASAVIDFLR